MTAASYKPEDPHTKIVKLYGGYQFSCLEKELVEVVFLKAGLSDHNWCGNQLQVPAHKKNLYTLTVNKYAKRIKEEIDVCTDLAWSKRQALAASTGIESLAWCGTGLEMKAWGYLITRIQQGQSLENIGAQSEK